MAGLPAPCSSRPTCRKLLHAGHRVAICEQVEDAGPGQGAGHAARSRASSRRHRHRGRPARPAAANHLVAVVPRQRAARSALAWVDLSTGHVLGRRRRRWPRLADELARLAPGRVPGRRARSRQSSSSALREPHSPRTVDRPARTGPSTRRTARDGAATSTSASPRSPASASTTTSPASSPPGRCCCTCRKR